jgi:hypothetical protein
MLFEAKLLENENAGKVFMGEYELAAEMTRHVAERMRSGTGKPAPSTPSL